MNKIFWIVGVIVLLIVIAIIVSAVANRNRNSDLSPSPTLQESPTATAQVIIENFTFTPSPLVVKAGDTVAFVNRDSVDHTVTSTSFSSGTIRPGQVFMKTFTDLGQFNYHCSIHPNMQGQIIVE